MPTRIKLALLQSIISVSTRPCKQMSVKLGYNICSLYNSAIMKKLMITLAMAVLTLTFAFGQDVKQEAKETANQAGRTAKAAGRKVARETREERREIKQAANKAGDKIDRAAKNTKEDVKDGTNKALNKTERKLKKAERKLDNSK